MKISIMQPYFYPYQNYFNLIKESELMVILDDVQFVRRGFIHRCIIDFQNRSWLTLPIDKHPVATNINEIKFKKNANEIFFENIIRLKKKLDISKIKKIYTSLEIREIYLIDYLLKNLKFVCETQKIKFKYILSSSIKKRGKKEDLIIDICKKVGAKDYINLPGGKKIYNIENFKKNNLNISFLDNYFGSYESVFNEIIK